MFEVFQASISEDAAGCIDGMTSEVIPLGGACPLADRSMRVVLYFDTGGVGHGMQHRILKPSLLHLMHLAFTVKGLFLEQQDLCTLSTSLACQFP